jgi:hypothetical protein
VNVTDEIRHKEGCSRYVVPQATHFKKKRWVPQEKRANALVGVRATPASGAMNMDGDGRSIHGWRVESKGTSNDRYILTQAVWSKLVKGALEAGERPMLHVELRSKIPHVRRVLILSTEAVLPALHTLPLTRTGNLRIDEGYTPSIAALDPPALVLTEPELDEVIGGETADL